MLNGQRLLNASRSKSTRPDARPARDFRVMKNRDRALVYGATISSDRWRLAVLPMRISPMRLGVFVVMVGLLCVTTPAHARRVRNVGNSPDNPQNPTQPVNIGAPQPAPANAAGTPYPNSNPYSNPYRSGVAQPSYTPNINNQPRPQYQPNAYVAP